ncbi:MAG: hypothetical protein C4K49_08625 [Candidatus Thorarchaeota archaeon]|nr:MAG: hypothetical protein C4K49_08625 [Candidatus Thorarchaeota archaeon]
MTEDAEKLEKGETEAAQTEGASKEEETGALAEPPRPSYREMLSSPLGYVFNVRMLRRVVQIVFFLGINAYVMVSLFGGQQFVAFWTEFSHILPSIPILAPLQGPAAILAGSFDTLQREFSSGLFPFFTIGAMMIILTVIGRTACAWACPIGTIQDFATLPKRNKIRPAPSTEEEMRRVKAYIFIIVMFLVVWVGISRWTGTSDMLTAALGPFAVAAFDPFNPAYILFVALPNIISQHLWPVSLDTLWYILQWGWFLGQFVFVIVVVMASVWFPRWFCRWLCPAGWIYGVFSKDALIGIGRNPAKCTPETCNVCEAACPMNIRIRRYPYQHMHSPDCIMCLECKSHCPNKAIVVRFS